MAPRGLGDRDLLTDDELARHLGCGREKALAVLLAEVERLRAEAAKERAAVVAWLRGQRGAGGSALVPSIAKGLAHAIESGDHRREENE